MTSAEIALFFVNAFCEGRIDDLDAVLHEEFELTGPRGHFAGKRNYLDALRADPPAPGPFSVVSVKEEAGEVTVVYRRVSNGETMHITQGFVIDAGRILSTTLTF